MTAPHFEDVLTFWLGELDDDGLASEAQRKKWFEKNPAFDDEIKERFGATHSRVAAGEHDDWLASPRGRVAWIIVLDQLSRNMFRDSGAMYDHDDKALLRAREGVDEIEDDELVAHERSFLYMPFMHSENLADQDRCIGLFERSVRELGGAAADSLRMSVDFAVKHRAIVARFGRFPHRNALLGRENTEAEAAFLKQPGSGF